MELHKERDRSPGFPHRVTHRTEEGDDDGAMEERKHFEHSWPR